MKPTSFVLDVDAEGIVASSEFSQLLPPRGILALAYVQDPIALPYIEKALRSDATSGQTLAVGLVRMGDPGSARVLLSVFADVYDPFFAIRIIGSHARHRVDASAAIAAGANSRPIVEGGDRSRPTCG